MNCLVKESKREVEEEKRLREIMIVRLLLLFISFALPQSVEMCKARLRFFLLFFLVVALQLASRSSRIIIFSFFSYFWNHSSKRVSSAFIRSTPTWRLFKIQLRSPRTEIIYIFMSIQSVETFNVDKVKKGARIRVDVDHHRHRREKFSFKTQK